MFLGSPSWLLPAAAIAVLALLVLVWSYLRTPGRASTRIVAAALKAVAFAAILAFLLEPLVRGTRPRPGANLFLVLADDSQSLAIRDPGARETRAEQLRALLREDAPWHIRLSQDFDVRRYSFAERLRALTGVDALTAQGTRSGLAGALATLAERFADRPIAGVLLFTDGNATDLGDVTSAFRDLPPVYPVALASAEAPRDVRIADLGVSQTNFEAAPVTIQTTVAADGYAGRPLTIALVDAAGKEVQRQTLTLAADELSRTVRLRFRPERAGLHFYEVRVAPAAEFAALSDQLVRSGEATLANNRRLAVVDRPIGPYRVLYVAGRPNWEYKFLHRAVEADKEVELVGLLRIAKREPKFAFLGRQGEDTNPLFRGFEHQAADAAEQYDEPVLVRFGTRDQDELRGGFPKTAEELFAYDAVVFDDLESGFFTAAQFELLERFVARRGGGLLMLGGAESFAQGDYRRTPVERLLPVYLDRAPPADGAVSPAAPFRLSLTREGWLQPWVRLRDTEETERARLASMPEFNTLNRVRRLKPGASILAGVTSADGRALPALVAQSFGEGRTAALLIGDFWRWGLKRPDGAADDLAKAWRQTIRWLVADVPRRVELDVQRVSPFGAGLPTSPVRRGSPDPAASDSVEIRVTVRDAEYLPLDGAAIRLTVTPPDGQSHELRAEPAADAPGVYTASYTPRQPGAYRVAAEVAGPDRDEIGRREAGFAAEPQAEEFRRLAPDASLLDRLARETKGEVIAPDGLDRFVASLSTRRVPITEPWDDPLWQRPWALLLALGCLIGEWGLRRWRGLP